MCVAEGKYPLLGAGAFLISPGSAEDAVVLALVQRLAQGLCLHYIGMHPTPMTEGTDSLIEAFLVGVDKQLQPKTLCRLITKLDHLFKFPGSVNMQQGKWQLARSECLQCQMQQDGGILANGIEQHWTFKLCCRLPENINALGFKLLQVFRHHDNLKTLSSCFRFSSWLI